MTFTRSVVARSLVASLFVAAISTLSAQSVVTDPVGFTTLTVAGKPGAARGFTYVALNMFRPTAYRSSVVSVSAPGSNTVLTFPAGSFTVNQFATGVSPNFSHFIEIANGSTAGVLADVVSNDTTSITLSEDISAMITAGTTQIKVRPHWTFATAFGANNSAGFQGSNTPTNADALSLLNGSTKVFTSYFYSTTNNRWQRGGVDASNDIIRPDQCLQVERKVTSPVTFTLVGEVKLGPDRNHDPRRRSVAEFQPCFQPVSLELGDARSVWLIHRKSGDGCGGFQYGDKCGHARNLESGHRNHIQLLLQHDQ